LPVELLIAPPGSGKTETCLKKIQALGMEKPLARVWVIVPDRLQAAAFRKRLASGGGALGVQVSRFEDLYQSILEHAGKFVPSASFPLLHRLVQETVDRSVEQGELVKLAPLQLFPGFITTLREVFAELKRGLVAPDNFTEFARTGSNTLKDLAILYSRYQARLEELNLADPEGFSGLAASLMEKQPTLAASIDLLIVDGFDSFNGAQYQALKCLSKQAAELVITFPGLRASQRTAHRRFTDRIERLIRELSPKITELDASPHLPADLGHIERHLFEATASKVQAKEGLLLLEARSPAEEAREALRWIKKIVIRQHLSLASCVIFTPDPAIYHPLLRSIAEEFGMPIRFTLDEKLENSPAITALLKLLTLPLNRYKSRALINVLRAPYFDFSMDDETLDTLERVSRVAQIVESREQWNEAWQRLAASTSEDKADLDDERNAPSLPRGPDVEALQRALDSVFVMITPPEQTAAQTDWIDWLEDLLEKTRFYEKADNERDQSAVEVFRESLRALVLSESVSGERRVDYHQFMADLQGTLTGEGYRESKGEWKDSLLVGHMTEARGTRYQAVALLGLSEGSFPQNERSDPFLDEDLRARLGLELRLQREQGGLFYQAVSRADQNLLITRPYLSDTGESREKSAFWKAVEVLFIEPVVTTVKPDVLQPLSEAGSSQELLFTAVRRGSLPKKYNFLVERWNQLKLARDVLTTRRAKQAEGDHEGFVEAIAPVLNLRYPASETWSASRFEAYGTCPFQFYIKTALNLEPRELPELGLDSRQRGSILHEVLEKTYRNAADPMDIEALMESLRKACNEVFSTAPRMYGFRPSALWEIEQEQLLKKLEISICVLAEDIDWTPFAYEEGFGFEDTPVLELELETETIRVHGVIDRVDRNANGELRVIDYKTGSSHLDKSDLENGYSLQLPIYAMAARDALHLGDPVDGIYWAIFAAKAGSLKLGKYSKDDMEGVEAAIGVVKEHLLRIVPGIRAAKFPAKPPKGGCASYCPASLWCWRYEPGRQP
jgi:ATP-dependent helicase/nuclease subunit B